MNTYDAHGPNPFPRGDARSNVIEVKVAENDVRRGHEYAYDGGGQAYRDELAQGFLAARDNGPESRPTGLADSGRSNPSQWTRVNPASLSERPRQVYETTTGSDARTGAFARANPNPRWDQTADHEMLVGFAVGTLRTDATGATERPGNTIQVQVADNPRTRRNPAEIGRAGR